MTTMEKPFIEEVLDVFGGVITGGPLFIDERRKRTYLSQTLSSGIPVAVYCDGGLLGKNEAVIGCKAGGTWAVVTVDAQGNILKEKSGLLRPGCWACPNDGVTNNESELCAAHQALQMMPDGWAGTLYLDSDCTRKRILKPNKPWTNVAPLLQRRVREEMARLGNFKMILLAGHPEPEDLERGYKLEDASERAGLPVSIYNQRADILCNERRFAYKLANPKSAPLP